MSDRASGKFLTFLTCEMILRVVKKVDRGIFLDFFEFFQRILRYFPIEACPVYRYPVSRARYPVLYHSWIQHLFKLTLSANQEFSCSPIHLTLVKHAQIYLKIIYTFLPFLNPFVHSFSLSQILSCCWKLKEKTFPCCFQAFETIFH